MMLRTLGVVAALLLTTSLAQAAFNADGVVAQLTSDGYTQIEVKVGQKIAKVEAIKGTTKIEVTYDIASGDVLESQTEAVEAGDDTAPGVEIKDHQGGQGDDDGPNHDVNDDNGGGNDDGANPGHGGTAPGQDDSPNHDVNDDNGGGNDDGANPGHDGTAPGQDDDHGGQGGDDGDEGEDD